MKTPKQTDAPKTSKNVSKIMAVIGWSIITLAVTFGGGMYTQHTLAEVPASTKVQAPKE